MNSEAKLYLLDSLVQKMGEEDFCKLAEHYLGPDNFEELEKRASLSVPAAVLAGSLMQAGGKAAIEPAQNLAYMAKTDPTAAKAGKTLGDAAGTAGEYLSQPENLATMGAGGLGAALMDPENAMTAGLGGAGGAALGNEAYQKWVTPALIQAVKAHSPMLGMMLEKAGPMLAPALGSVLGGKLTSSLFGRKSNAKDREVLAAESKMASRSPDLDGIKELVTKIAFLSPEMAEEASGQFLSLLDVIDPPMPPDPSTSDNKEQVQ